MTNQKNQPADTLRDGALKATIWQNFGDNGNFYSVEFSRTYTDQQGNFRDSHSLSGSEPLQLARLAHKAYDRIAELRGADRDAAGEQAGPNDGRVA